MSAAIPVQLPEPDLAIEKSALLHQLVDGLQSADLYWLAAWITAQAGSLSHTTAATHKRPAVEVGLTVLYGSQTGHARQVAEERVQRGHDQGIRLHLVRADTYPLRNLAKERYLIIVISTHGEGESPDDARGLVEWLSGKRAPRLPNLHFSVLGPGDLSSPKFCAGYTRFTVWLLCNRT